MIFKVGDKIKVKLSIEEPYHGWGSVKHESVGIVCQIDDVKSIWCDFPEQKAWHARPDEMCLVRPLSLENK